jgi:hypothetical protein
VLDATDRHAEEGVDAAHPFGVASREVVVDRHHVDAVAGQRVQVRRQGRDESLALSGAHLGDLALVEDHTADELDVEVAHTQHALTGLTHDREGFRKQVVQHLAGSEAGSKLVFLGAELAVGERRDPGLEPVDAVHDRPETLEGALVFRAHHLGQERIDHENLLYQTELPGPVTAGAATRP